MGNDVVTRLDAVEVLDPEGMAVRLGSLWAERPVLLVMIRHFGCIFCKEQTAQFNPLLPTVREAGGEIVVLGNGAPEHARWFIEDFGIDMPVYTDPELRSQTIVGARRAKAYDPRHFFKALKAWRGGFRQTKTMGQTWMLGGVFVITPDGRMPYRYLSRFAGDHPDPKRPLATLLAEAGSAAAKAAASR